MSTIARWRGRSARPAILYGASVGRERREAPESNHLTSTPAGIAAPKGRTLPETPTDTQDLRPHFEDVQSHYDLSDDFYRLFLDPTSDLQLRVLRARRHDPGRGPVGQDRPLPRQARSAARDDAARRRLRLGRHSAPSHRTLRRQRHRPDAEPQPAGPRRGRASPRWTARAPSECCCRAGSSFTKASTASSPSARSNTSAWTVTTTSSRWPTRRCQPTA